MKPCVASARSSCTPTLSPTSRPSNPRTTRPSTVGDEIRTQVPFADAPVTMPSNCLPIRGASSSAAADFCTCRSTLVALSSCFVQCSASASSSDGEYGGERPVSEFRFGGERQPARRAAVGIARTRVAARMVMGEHDPGAAMLGGVGDDRPQWKIRPRIVARMARQMDAARPLVGVRDPQVLAARIAVGQAAREEGPGRGEPVELQRRFGTLIPHGVSLASARSNADCNRVG